MSMSLTVTGQSYKSYNSSNLSVDITDTVQPKQIIDLSANEDNGQFNNGGSYYAFGNNSKSSQHIHHSFEEVNSSQRSELDADVNTVNLQESNNGNQDLENQTQLNILKPPSVSLHGPPLNLYRYIFAIVWIFSSGFSDAAPGALLPSIEKYYGINYSIVSLVWCGNAIGFLLVAFLSDKIQLLLGKHKSICLGTLSSIIGYSIISSGTSRFPAIVFAFVLCGVGVAINLSQLNIFVTRLDTFYLGLFHSFYGIGATIAPVVGTLVISNGHHWHYVYIVPLGVMSICATGFVFAFKGYDADLKKWDAATIAYIAAQDIELSDYTNANVNPPQNASGEDPTDPNIMKLALKHKITWLLAVFTLFYQGSEVSLAGWIVTFLLKYRDGKSSVGYVASGFWFGLTLGRLILTSLVYKYLNARRGILLFTLISIGFIILTWTIPELITSGVLISICGIFIGPIYPVLIGFSAMVLPRKIQIVSMTMLSAFGSSGGALFPFIIGLISQAAGAYVVLPISIALLSSMVVIWLILPYSERKGMAKHWWNYVW